MGSSHIVYVVVGRVRCDSQKKRKRITMKLYYYLVQLLVVDMYDSSVFLHIQCEKYRYMVLPKSYRFDLKSLACGRSTTTRLYHCPEFCFLFFVFCFVLFCFFSFFCGVNPFCFCFFFLVFSLLIDETTFVLYYQRDVWQKALT